LWRRFGGELTRGWRLRAGESKWRETRTADIATSVLTARSVATSARKLIDHLDPGILAKAFRGELVPQDPNDEPASVSLGADQGGERS
jgi:hypothetical protein